MAMTRSQIITRSKKASARVTMEKLLSLPMDIQVEALCYLDMESQIAASKSWNPWASILLSFYATQIPRRFPEIHEETGFRDISALLDSGRQNWYVRTACEYGIVYTYFFIKSRGRALAFDQKGYLDIPDTEEGRDISSCPLLYDKIFPNREFNIRQPQKTTITDSGEIRINKHIKRVKWKPLTPFFILLDLMVPLPQRRHRYAHRLHDPRAIGWREKMFKFNVYKKATVIDLVQGGIDILWDMNRKGNLPRKRGVYQVFVEI
ncbi:hypothetical protein TWF225_008054 [Orbilia oligospora]|uniref:Uncharacterized protein n=1 Tax=Orbilia oligospora TaxID=2813651 RepID=A0A7C8PKZ9_ORBOL|nr:hypothetical protein TWF751_010566 [Orbilia oligospora]KAF3177777.1 hypothetical protein TWF225_008054 [Orbilia oligospora]KAF3239810.1 hypothetical protein TWF128_011693 [Orbilia oligospora]KAF3248007.1 hypothetical protein TWF217_009465 [Orbilia oligospora]TGJ67023.1 hypothetical protein EYR41_008608 [Orbilia oligospora]